MDDEKKRKGETKASPLNGTAPRRMEDTTGREVTASRPEPTSLTLAQGLKAPVGAPGKEPGLSQSMLPGTKAPVPEPGLARPNVQPGIQPGQALVKAQTGSRTNNIESSGGYSRIDAPTFTEYEKNNRPKLVDLLGWAPKTKEELERDEKTARRRALISGIGDMMSALSSLYFTTKGAPNMYDHHNSMSEKARARYERQKAEYDRNRREYFNAAMGMYRDELDNYRWHYNKKQQEQQTQHQLEREAKQDALAAEQARRDDAIHKLNLLKLQGAIDKQEAEAEIARIKANGLTDEQTAKLAKLYAETGAANARATASYAQAGYYNRKDGGGSSGGSGASGNSGSGKYSLNPDTGRRTYRSQSDYERDVYAWAEKYGIPTTENRTKSNGKNRPGQKQQVVKVKKPVAKIAAEVEREAQRRLSGHYVYDHGLRGLQKQSNSTQTGESQSPKTWGNTSKLKW